MLNEEIKIDIPVYKFEDFTAIKLSEVHDESKRKRLIKFMEGQTRPLVHGIGINELIYSWDYESFLRMEKTGKEPIWD